MRAAKSKRVTKKQPLYFCSKPWQVLTDTLLNSRRNLPANMFKFAHHYALCWVLYRHEIANCRVYCKLLQHTFSSTCMLICFNLRNVYHLLLIFANVMVNVQVRIVGQQVEAQNSRLFQQISYNPEENPLWPLITLEEHLECYAALRGVPAKDIRRFVGRLISLWNECKVFLRTNAIFTESGLLCLMHDVACEMKCSLHGQLVFGSVQKCDAFLFTSVLLFACCGICQ